MSGKELPEAEGMDTPTSQTQPHPATIQEGFSYCHSDGFAPLNSSDSPLLSFQQTPSDVGSRTVSIQSLNQDFLPMDNSPWPYRHCDDGYGMPHLDSDMPNGQVYTTDEAIRTLHLEYNSAHEGEPLQLSVQSRHMSGSSFTMSTSGALSDIPSCDDFSTALSEVPSFSSDYPPPSDRNFPMSSTRLSPVASPRMTPQSRTDLVRTQSRGRASPLPRPHIRSAPYSVGASRNKRSSTDSSSTTASPLVAPIMDNQHAQKAFIAHQHGHPSIPMASHQMVQRNSMRLPSPLPSQVTSQTFTQESHHSHHSHHFEISPPPPSLEVLQSNADHHSLHGHSINLSGPLNLFSSLHEEQAPPPSEDMNPSDPDMIPHEQELRFEGDLYTPKWVRGHGNKREGWCGTCKPGRWLMLKNSTFWYDKPFAHGICAATGSPFQEPQLPTHHHHHLPESGPPSKHLRHDEPGGGAPSVVGQAGMPSPAPRPRGPKLKFTPEDDQLLIELKEHKNLTWKQIADFFPGRSSGTLQVRYCTKLKPKTTQWTDETDHKLRTALQDYENEKWRIVANKFGTKFTPAACRERAAELNGELPPGLPPSSPLPGDSASEPRDTTYTDCRR